MIKTKIYIVLILLISCSKKDNIITESTSTVKPITEVTIASTNTLVTFSSKIIDTQISDKVGFEVIYWNNYFWLMGGRPVFKPSPSLTNEIWNSKDGTNWTRVLENANWDDRGNFNLFEYQNKLWIVGGEGNPINTDGSFAKLSSYWKRDVWNSVDGTNWVKVIEHGPWELRLASAVAPFNNELYLIGGQSTTNWLLYQDIYKSSNGKDWNKAGEISDLLLKNEETRYGLSHFDLIVFNNKLFLLGGKRTSAYSSFEWVLESGDGINWSVAQTETPWKESEDIDFIRPFVFKNRLWVIVQNKLYSSINGKDWMLQIVLPTINKFPLFQPRTIVKDNAIYIIGSYIRVIGDRDDKVHVIKLEIN